MNWNGSRLWSGLCNGMDMIDLGRNVENEFCNGNGMRLEWRWHIPFMKLERNCKITVKVGTPASKQWTLNKASQLG